MQTVQLAPINNNDESSSEENEDDYGGGLQEAMGEYAELEYFCQAASLVAAAQGARAAVNTGTS